MVKKVTVDEKTLISNCLILKRQGFAENVFPRERVKHLFFVTFNIIMRHIFPENIFPENFIEIPKVVQKI